MDNVEVVVKNKMQIARDVFAQVTAEGADLGEQKSARQAFIAMVMEQADMSKNGAGTYWQNLSNEQKGMGLYKYHKKAEPVEKAVKALRWLVVDEAGFTVSQHKTRKEAKEVAEQQQLLWADAHEIAKQEAIQG